MREIKFRAWDFDTKEMLYGGSLSDGCLYFTFSETSDRQNKRFPEYMQFTGLKDKNGKEIYEGDILANQLGTVEVKWHRQSWTPFIDDKGTAFEVIGNVWENPELLK